MKGVAHLVVTELHAEPLGNQGSIPDKGRFNAPIHRVKESSAENLGMQQVPGLFFWRKAA